MQLRLVHAGKSEHITFSPKVLICAGFSGRDSKKVADHIEELAKIGVSPPSKIPAEYRLPTSLLTTSRQIRVRGPKTSGEVEYVILRGENDLYVTVGSDHTDRLLERVDMEESKAVCPKVIAPEVWSYKEVKSHWDEMELRSAVPGNSGFRIYQEGKVSDILPPLELIRKFNALDYGTVLFSGTVPLKSGVAFSARFRMTMADPSLRRSISHEYAVKVVDSD